MDGGSRWRAIREPVATAAVQAALDAGSPRWAKRSSARSPARVARPAPGRSDATPRASSPGLTAPDEAAAGVRREATAAVGVAPAASSTASEAPATDVAGASSYPEHAARAF